MSYPSVDPATGVEFAKFPAWEPQQVQAAVDGAVQAQREWRGTAVQDRAAVLAQLGNELLERKAELAGLMTREMGKLAREADSEIEKCAWVCSYYARHAEEFLADEPVDSDASRSLIVRQPLGVILAIMPWNFPFWQVFRCAAPALAGGNGVLLKHASNVFGCALAIESLFEKTRAPQGLFRSLLIGGRQAQALLEDPGVAAVSLTGSDQAGREVAAAAGAQIKKSVLELGGSDPFIVLQDANIEAAVEAAAASRFLNCGQSCIAAKRFLVAEACADEFTEGFVAAALELEPGDPAEADTGLAPMARGDLREDLHSQVRGTVDAGARLLTGGRPVGDAGFFYAPTIVDRVPADSPMARDETFGPAAAITSFGSEEEALAIANGSRFGLGASVWSTDIERAESLARRLECGSAFVNGMVKSDPRLPFGGVKDSGYGRELSRLGIEEFINAKTLWIA